jgi:uncharacterized paraquat-inducible protein A
MQRGKLNRRERPHISTEAILAQKDKLLVCQECREICEPKMAMGSSKRPRCPKCGGTLHRE